MATSKKKATGSQKRYRNSGVTTLVIEGQEINPDDEFTATLDPDYELQMFMGGHLELLQDQSSAADKAQAEGAEAGAVNTATDSGNVAEAAPERRQRRNQS